MATYHAFSQRTGRIPLSLTPQFTKSRHETGRNVVLQHTKENTTDFLYGAGSLPADYVKTVSLPLPPYDSSAPSP